MQCMTSQLTPSPDPHTSDHIARAEHRRAKLEALSDMGMVMSKKICFRWVDGPYHPEPRHDAGKSFAAVSRAVRLTSTLEARVDDHILALRKGVLPAVKPWGPAVTRGLPLSGVSASDVRQGGAGEGGGYRSTAEWREAFEREADSLDEETDLLGRVGEGLIEGEAEDVVAGGDFDVCVDIIRADLGLSPLCGKGALAEGERGGEVVAPASPTLDPTTNPRTLKDLLRANSALPPCAPSVTARERAPRHLPRKRAGEEYG